MDHALAARASSQGKWIMDSGATSHMCGDQRLFKEFHTLDQDQEVTLGDGHALKATGRGKVTLRMNLPMGKLKCTLSDVLLVPKLAYNLFSVSKATEAGKTTEFGETTCRVKDGDRLVAQGYKQRGLYILDHRDEPDQVHITSSNTWHRRFGHLGNQGLAQLKNQKMVDGLELMTTPNSATKPCVPCLEGRQHRTPFPEGEKRPAGVLDLVHSDVCGKMGNPSLSKAEYCHIYRRTLTLHLGIFPQVEGPSFRDVCNLEEDGGECIRKKTENTQDR